MRETLHNLFVLVKGFFSFGLRANPQISLDNPELLKLPFGVAVAIATIAFVIARRSGDCERTAQSGPKRDRIFVFRIVVRVCAEARRPIL